MSRPDLHRRAFLKQATAAGGTLVTVPAFLAGCGVVPAIDGSAEPPARPFADWFALDERDLVRVLAELGAGGADFGEIFLEHARSTHLVLDDGMRQPALADIRQGAGLRVVAGERTGFAATEDLTQAALAHAARDAAAGGVGQAAAVLRELERRAAAGVYPVAVPFSDVAAADKWAIVERAAHSARAADPAISAVTVEWRDSDEHILIATLDGRVVEDRRPLASLSVQVSASRGGVTHAGFASLSARASRSWFSDARVDELAATAADRALRRFDARTPPSGELPVILAAGVSGILLHEAVGHALEGDYETSGARLFANRLGDRVAAAAVTLIDDATVAHARGALGVDDEGSDTGRTVLIEDGVLQSYLHDRQSARRAGAESTASARRESFRHAPLPRMSCTYLADGPHSAEALVADLKLGIVAETFTGGRADPASGDFAFTVASGWLIEDGRRTAPIRDVPLSGNGAALVAGIEKVAADGTLGAGSWTCGKRGQRVPVSLGMPTTLVSGLTIGAPDSA